MQTFPLNYFPHYVRQLKCLRDANYYHGLNFLDICILVSLMVMPVTLLCQSDPSDSIRTISIRSFADR